MSLPDDLLLSCITRVSRLYYPTLSLVSKRFRSLLTSPDLYKARSLLGNTESCLYVCLRGYSDYKTKWFTLCRKPDRLLSNKDMRKNESSSGYVLARALIPHSHVNSLGHGLVAFGSSIYNFGGSMFSSTSSILDCTTHSWSEAPRYSVKLFVYTACVVDRKIYVAGSYKDSDTCSLKNSIEVLDTETQIWDHVPIPGIKYWSYSKSACIDGKFQLESGIGVVAYDSKEGRWDLVRQKMYWNEIYCEIRNVMYSVRLPFGFITVFTWFDTEASLWRDLKGLEGLPKLPHDARFKLADYGGNLVVFWEEGFPFDPRSQVRQKMIWCAEIELERRNSCEIWGKVLWFDIVLIVPVACNLVKVLAVTV